VKTDARHSTDFDRDFDANYESMVTARESSIACSIRSREQEGSCNACQCRDEETVVLVEMKTLSFRVCERCAKELRKKLEALEDKRG
jgi:hypothetical protein